MFSDSEISSVGFMQIPVQKTETRNAVTLTSLDLSVEKAVQTTSVTNASSQTVPSDNTKTKVVEDEALLRFLRKAFPKLEEELKSTYRTNYFCSSLLNDDNESDVTFMKKIAALDRHENFDHKKMIINHLCWNSNGTSIAVSLTYTSHTDWCKHSSHLLIYKTDKNGELKSEIANSFEINTCITDLKYHPVNPRLLFLCTYEGKIMIYNFQNEEYEITQIKGQNNERISQITWVKRMNNFWLVMAGFDGDLNLWNNVPYNEQDYRLRKRYKFLNEDGKLLEKVSSFAFSMLIDDLVIVAGEGGILLGYFLKDQIPSSKTECVTEFMYTYEHPKQEIYSIKFSPVIDALFAVLSSHECVYIYDYTKKVPLQIIHPICPVLGLEWNFNQENVLKMWAVDGSMYFYDYCRTAVIKSIKISDHELLFLSFYKKTSKQQIVASDSYGNITIWEIALNIDCE